MDWKLAIEEERAMLERIVALLLALAGLAEQAGSRTPAVRLVVLWLLLAGEAVARSFVTLAPAPCPFRHAGASRADAMRLARRFRNLARALTRELDYWKAASSTICDDWAIHAAPAWLGLLRTPRSIDILRLIGLAVPAPIPALPCPAGFPDTS